MTFILEALSSLGLISKPRRFKVDLIVSLRPLVGSPYSLKDQCDTLMIWALTIEQLLGSLQFLVIHLDNILLTMFVGIKMRRFIT
ncbi:hypothetical protein LINPERPRIM_LOCUS6138 [Linum perenne]